MGYDETSYFDGYSIEELTSYLNYLLSLNGSIPLDINQYPDNCEHSINSGEN